MADATAPPELSAAQASATMRSKAYVVLLVLAGLVGIIVSLAAWCFLELVHQMQQEGSPTSLTRSATPTVPRSGGRSRSS